MKDPSSGKISREQAKKIVLKTRDASITGVRSDPEYDRLVNGVNYYFIETYALTEGFAASTCYVSSKDGKIYSWSDSDELEQ